MMCKALVCGQITFSQTEHTMQPVPTPRMWAVITLYGVFGEYGDRVRFWVLKLISDIKRDPGWLLKEFKWWGTQYGQDSQTMKEGKWVSES